MTNITIGKLLNLPSFHHFYSIPVFQHSDLHENFLIVYNYENNIVYVDLQSESGKTVSHVLQVISIKIIC